MNDNTTQNKNATALHRAACETGRRRGPRRLRTALTGAAALLATTALGGLVLAQVAVAQSVEWEGTQSDDWFDGDNWNGGPCPSRLTPCASTPTTRTRR